MMPIDLKGNEHSGNYGHRGRKGEVGGSAPGHVLFSPSDALVSILNGERVSIARESVRSFLEKARRQPEDPDLTDVQVEGMTIFGGNGLGIKREDMPQIPREMRDDFLKTLKKEGVTITKEMVDPLSLAPTQKEISARLVGEKLREYERKHDKKFPPLLVAKDSHVVDGHHHWGVMAAVAVEAPTAKVPIYRIHLSPKALLARMHAYDKAHDIQRKATGLSDMERRRQFLLRGNEHSGNHGHAGRPGEVGGSAPAKTEQATTAPEGRDPNPAPASHTVAVPTPEPLGTTRPEPILAKDLNEAVDLILQGKVVELKDVQTVHTVLSKLADIAKDAKAKGKDAPHYDLCNVSVAGTNLFCGSAVKTERFPNGIPRIEMPQLTGKPRAGSEADKLPKTHSGRVDAVDAFMAHLKESGIGVSSVQSVPASTLKATQIELVGETVAGMMTAGPDPETGRIYDPGKDPIFVSSDGYVLDGHHRWAAVVGRDAEDGTLGQSRMNVRVVDAPIIELLDRAELFVTEFGVLPKSGKAKTALAMVFDGDVVLLPFREKLKQQGDRWNNLTAAVRLSNFDESQHPRDEGGRFTDGLSYPALKAKGFTVTKGEAAQVMKRTAKAEHALAALTEVASETTSFGPEIEVLNKAMHILRQRVVPRALLTVVDDEEPILD